MRRTLSGIGSVKSTSLVLAHALVLLVCAVVLTGSAAAGGAALAAGPRTDQTFLSFTASNGLKSQYHVYAAGVPATSPCAVFQFHGDGAYEFRHPASPYSLGGANGIVAKARTQGCLTIPILTPDTVGAVTWWENGTANARFARDLITKVVSDYKINTSRMWLVGYSGGAQLITQYFLPLHSASIQGGGAVLFGGGGAPRASGTTPLAASLRSTFRLHWYTGANDDGRGGTYNAMRDARAGETYYRAAGFTTSHEYPAATGHALDGRFGAVLARQLAAQSAAAAPRPAASTPPPPTRWVHKVVPSRTGATAQVDIPSGTARTTFRVSAYSFGSQTGFFVFTTRVGKNIELTLPSLSPGETYHYQIEAGRDRHVVASGVFSTLP